MRAKLKGVPFGGVPLCGLALGKVRVLALFGSSDDSHGFGVWKRGRQEQLLVVVVVAVYWWGRRKVRIGGSRCVPAFAQGLGLWIAKTQSWSLTHALTHHVGRRPMVIA